MEFKAVIFDLDGVIISTDEYHYLAWKQLSERENIPFDREINQRLRGVSRMESLDIILEKSKKPYSLEQRLEMAEYKNNVYKEYIKALKPRDILPKAKEVIELFRQNKIKIAIGSSSKNAFDILVRIGLIDMFDAIADGNCIKNSKPDPEVFLIASKKLGVEPRFCLVVEDANAGIDAAKACGMKALGVGFAYDYPRADYRARDLSDWLITLKEQFNSCGV